MDLITRKTELSANLVAFCRHLRTKGFPLGPNEEADALKALNLVGFNDAETFRVALKAVLARSRAHQKIFDELYSDYWKDLSKAVDSKVTEEQTQSDKPQKSKQKQPSLKALKSWLYGNTSEEEEAIAAYSGAKAMTYRDFSSFTDVELEEVMKLIQIIAKSLATQYNRRFTPSNSHRNFDLRRTMRLNMRRGGEIVELAHKQRRIRKLSLVVICDVSKSMDLYSQFLVQFLYGFQTVYKRIETFVFSTSLRRITDQLRGQNFEDALEKLALHVPDWSGGTRIGESLHTFVENYGKRMLNDRTVVMILSDGWDTGDTDLLANSMERIQQKAAKVIWLNPLAGNPEFEPTVEGMAVAMPFIDVFAPAHNIDSLRKAIRMIT